MQRSNTAMSQTDLCICRWLRHLLSTHANAQAALMALERDGHSCSVIDLKAGVKFSPDTVIVNLKRMYIVQYHRCWTATEG